MKKSIKILTLVLSLALICGALVVAAFATEETAITGVITCYSTDFTGLVGLGAGPSAGQLDTANKGKFYIDNKGTGTTSIEINEVDENSYFSWSFVGNTTTTGSSGNFSYTAPSGNGWGDVPTGHYDDYYYNVNKYYVMDVDIWYPEDVPNGGARFYLYNYYITTDDTNAKVSSATETNNGASIHFSNTENGVVITPGLAACGGNDEQYAMIDGAWNHVTFIVEPKISGSTMSLVCYTALNGTVIDVFTYTLPEVTAYTIDGAPVWVPKTVRWAYGDNDTSNNIMNLDNYSVRRLDNTYNGNLATVLAEGVGADLTTWESAIYKSDYKMPYGQTIATIGEAKYDSVQAAIKAYDGTAPIVLQKDINSTLVLDKVVEIQCGEYTLPEANVTAAEGYKVIYNADDNIFTSQTTSGKLKIYWDVCTCELDDCDETHPGDVEVTGYEGQRIGDTYTKSQDWSIVVGPTKYALTGWTDDYDEPVDLTTEITAEMCKDAELYLYPVIEATTTPISYVKGGTTLYTANLLTAISDADAGSTITLQNDAACAITTTKYITKDLTIDLNGYTLDLLTGKKCSMFGVSGSKSVTILGEKAGSTLIAGYPAAATRAGGTLFTASGNDVTITLKGKGLFVSCGAIYGSWSDYHVTVNIEDCYLNHNGGSDNPANVYVSSTGATASYTLNIKNATVKGLTAGHGGSSTDNAQSTINIENSVILSALFANGKTTHNLNTVVNVKGNSYVNTAYFTYAREINLSGKDNFFTTNDWISKATYAEGVEFVSLSNTVEHENYGHTWVPITVSDTAGVWDHEATLAVTSAPQTVTYSYGTALTVGVNVYDGETLLGTVKAVPGREAKVYTKLIESYADGWVHQNLEYWYTVDASVTADINVDIADATTKTVFEGQQVLYMNYTLGSNLQTNLYMPAIPEGVTDVVVMYGTLERTFKGEYTINGKPYTMNSVWPGIADADTDRDIVVTFTYGGQDYTVEYKGINVVSYAKQVIKLYGADSNQSKQAIALLQAVEAANYITTSVHDNGITEYLAELAPAATEIPETAADITALKDYITSASITVMTGNKTAIKFTLSETAVAAGVTVKFGGKAASIANGVATVEFGNITDWGDTEMTVEVTNGDTVVTGTYGVASYATENKANLSEHELAFVQALYALGVIGKTV